MTSALGCETGERPIIENAHGERITFMVVTRVIRPGPIPFMTATPVEQKCHVNCVHLSASREA